MDYEIIKTDKGFRILVENGVVIELEYRTLTVDSKGNADFNVLTGFCESEYTDYIQLELPVKSDG